MDADRREAIALLKRARDLISDPAHWVQGQMMTRDGKAFCQAGAMGWVNGGAGLTVTRLANDALGKSGREDSR